MIDIIAEGTFPAPAYRVGDEIEFEDLVLYHEHPRTGEATAWILTWYSNAPRWVITRSVSGAPETVKEQALDWAEELWQT